MSSETCPLPFLELSPGKQCLSCARVVFHSQAAFSVLQMFLGVARVRILRETRLEIRQKKKELKRKVMHKIKF